MASPRFIPNETSNWVARFFHRGTWPAAIAAAAWYKIFFVARDVHRRSAECTGDPLRHSHRCVSPSM